MAETALLVATGADRPGVMDELSQFLLENGGNISESRSVNLSGQFALLLLIRGEPDALATIRKGLPGLAKNRINAQLHPPGSQNSVEATTFPFIFTATGKDQAGVLHRISHLLRALNINIDDLQTRVNVKEGLFHIRLVLAVPRETPVAMLREYLGVLCNEMNVSGDLKEA